MGSAPGHWPGGVGRFVRLAQAEVPISPLGAHALAGLQNELALWWLEERRLTKAEIVEHTIRVVRAVIGETCADREEGDGARQPHGAAGP